MVTLTQIRRAALEICKEMRIRERGWLAEAEAGAGVLPWASNCYDNAAYCRHRRAEAVREFRTWRDIYCAAEAARARREQAEAVES